jgi:hypothetical protein
VIIAVIVAGGLGFYIGMHYSTGSTATSTSAYAGRLSGSRTATSGSSLVTGSIIAADSQGITVQLANGNSEIVFVATTTPIMKSVQGSMSDLSVGQNVVVTGTANSDGSITAQSVQLRPAGSGAFGPSPSRMASSSSQ